MGDCPCCGATMLPLFTGFFCPNDCDREFAALDFGFREKLRLTGITAFEVSWSGGRGRKRHRKVKFESVSPRDNHRAFDDVSQLANVTRPIVTLKSGHPGFCQTRLWAFQLLFQDSDEVFGEERNVFATLTERSNL